MSGDKTGVYAKQLIITLLNDLPKLRVLDNYLHGIHDLPYMPETADEEYMMLAERATMNWMPLLVGTPTQAMYVDGYQPGEGLGDSTNNSAWKHWQRSRLDAKQSSIYSGAFAYGHSFTLTERNAKTGKSETKGLSALRTAALFEDPANDIVPLWSLNVKKWASEEGSGSNRKITPGEAYMWSDTYKWMVWFDNLTTDGEVKLGWKLLGKHGNTENPVTRFAASVDLEGRTLGVIEPMKILNDRINQTVFDLLVAQTYGSFKVRWATGMAPPLKKRVIWLKDADGNMVFDEEGMPQIEDIVDRFDAQGRPMPEDVNLNAKRFMFAEDENVKFGAIDGTPLDGYIKSAELAVRQLAALSQTPPHHILGQIANLSAEALEAAETSLARKIQLFKTVFGECWERVFNLAAELDGDTAGALDFTGEVRWRDMEGSGLAKSADALNKLKELEIPRKGLWRRVPGITETEILEWERMAEEDPSSIISSAIRDGQNAAASQTSTTVATNTTPVEDGDLVP